ncbi:inositol monophosphatase [Roseivirga seohaensis]|uniref:Probable inosine/xanthosine triphosphatase n=1 Tax=Roseivirga seohaensis TaxID=1914963 RepID=A0A150XZQ2_9BACT|nr:inosine/xanthosine triphosphatase [Roseivirga seohaensis]KYG84270.1 inositol monophosphatase [Roseivirga seohaensis]
MIKVVIASQNPVKIKCTEKAFQEVFKNESFIFSGINVPSNVADQPMTDSETLEGARNRAKNAQSADPKADYWVGIEGGISETKAGEMLAFAWISIISNDQKGESRTATFTLPPKIVELIHQGIELGLADDMVFKRSNSKQSNGAVGILTHDLIDRSEYYRPAIVLALIPFINPELY